MSSIHAGNHRKPILKLSLLGLLRTVAGVWWKAMVVFRYTPDISEKLTHLLDHGLVSAQISRVGYGRIGLSFMSAAD